MKKTQCWTRPDLNQAWPFPACLSPLSASAAARTEPEPEASADRGQRRLRWHCFGYAEPQGGVCGPWKLQPVAKDTANLWRCPGVALFKPPWQSHSLNIHGSGSWPVSPATFSYKIRKVIQTCVPWWPDILVTVGSLSLHDCRDHTLPFSFNFYRRLIYLQCVWVSDVPPSDQLCTSTAFQVLSP